MHCPSDLALASSVHLLHDLPLAGAARWQTRVALTEEDKAVSYDDLAQQVERCASGLLALGLNPGERVAIYLDKRLEAVVAAFATTASGGVMVPINPVLKPAQVAHILQDAQAKVLITSSARFATLTEALEVCPDLEHAVLCTPEDGHAVQPVLGRPGPRSTNWTWLMARQPVRRPLRVETDMAAIFYTSGSTGRPKGVVLSHRNLLAGAASVASYLGNHSDDVLLAALPLSFDAGFSQLTTGFLVGARVVLLNHLFARDIVRVMAAERVTGITAVPPLYMQLAEIDWPLAASGQLRYFANTGGRLPRTTLERLRERAPGALPYLMYGLTEAFRSTYLPPSEIDRRPDSIGRAIPNADVRVLREDGSECEAGEPGELVHRGPLVALGYWRRPEETAARFRPWPADLKREQRGLPTSELAVFSGDVVRRDADGFLYFVGRGDAMIKTSGYRVSPTEVEEVVFASGLVVEAIALGRPNERLGQDIVVIAVPSAQASGNASVDTAAIMSHCRDALPAYMVPAAVRWSAGPLPRNVNGKLDRLAWEAKHERI
jgi:acyl-CoA ligase (AMP-forming) (exosortase A-associated)